MTNETMTKMGNIQVIENEKKLSNQNFLVFFFKLLLGDQKNFDRQINGEDQFCH
jgi:hypothetical protein